MPEEKQPFCCRLLAAVVASWLIANMVDNCVEIFDESEVRFDDQLRKIVEHKSFQDQPREEP